MRLQFMERGSEEWERAWAILLASEGTRDTSRPWAVTPLVCACGEEWQYMGTAENPHRDMRLNPELGMTWRHEFRHRCGDGCGMRRYAKVPASAAFHAAMALHPRDIAELSLGSILGGSDPREGGA